MESMLSFELSVIDIVLIIAVAILLSFHITRTPKGSNVKSKSSVEMEKSLEKGKMKKLVSKTSETKKSFTRLPEDSVKCPHHLGYLKTLPLGSSVPEECYSCSRMMQCLFSSEWIRREFKEIQVSS